MSGTVTIEYGNIETITADCIVNAANSGLRRGSGVCGALFAAAGEEVMTEYCRQIGHCPVGKAVATPPGRLSAKWVIHAVGPYTSRPDAPEMLCSAYVSALEIVREKKCRSVAFPLISSGVFNDAPMDFESLWSCALSAVRGWQAAHPDCPVDVRFVCHGRGLIAAGEKMLASLPQERDH